MTLNLKGDENEKTLEMMAKYGYEKIRGGNYCKTVILLLAIIFFIEN